jgi:branched-chain amino acid transport system substrate-binding protein
MLRISALVVATAFMFAGVAFSADVIKVGHLADLTGPTGEVGKPYAQGVQDFKEWVNAHGGINGKMLEMPMFDYAYNKDKAVNQYKKYKEEGVVAIQGWGSGDTEALSATTGSDKIPYISASYSAHLTDPKKTPYNFFCAADYTTGLRAGLKYLKDNWKEKRAPKVVFIYPNVPYGIAPIKGGKEYAKELGFEVLSDEIVDLKAIEANSQMLSVKNKGADFGWIGGTTNSAAVIMKDAKKLGLKTRFFVNIWGADETTPKLGRRRGRRARYGRLTPVRRQGRRDEAAHADHEEPGPGDALHPRLHVDDGPHRGAEARRQEGQDHR